MMLPLFLIDPEIEDNPKEGRKQIFNAFLFQFILFTIILIVCCCFYKEKPEIPPSVSSMDKKVENIWGGVKELFKNKNFLKLCVTFCIIDCVLLICAINIAALISPFGYSADNASILGILFIFSGAISASLNGIFLGKTKKFKLSYITTLTLSCLGI
jgi:Na+/melibiose symporter-like transporter